VRVRVRARACMCVVVNFAISLSRGLYYPLYIFHIALCNFVLLFLCAWVFYTD